MYRGVALGVVFLSCLYVAGYVYKYSFFLSMTHEIGWVDLDPSDYIAWGVYSLIDIMRINVVIIVVAYSAALTYFSSVVSFLFKVRGRLFLDDLSKGASRSILIVICVVGYYMVGWFILSWVARGIEDIEAMARREASDLINSGRVDVMCQIDNKECVKGKLFYTGFNDYIFYEHDDDVYSGKFHVVHKRNVSVQVGWNESSKKNMRELGKSGEGE